MESRTCSPLDWVASCHALKKPLRVHDDDNDVFHVFFSCTLFEDGILDREEF